MRQGKTLNSYLILYEYLLRNEQCALYTNDSKEHIKKVFKDFLFVNVKVKSGEGCLLIVSLGRNYFVNEKVNNIEEMMKLSNEGKSVYVTQWKRTSPAAFLGSWQARLLHKWIESGYIYTITKKEKV